MTNNSKSRLSPSCEFRALHLGPDPSVVGGMGSVLDAIDRNSIGGEIVVSPTWRSGTLTTRVWVAVRAAVDILFAPRSTVVHAHVSAAGSVYRKGVLLGLARLRRLPTVTTLHGSGFPAFAQAQPRVARWYLRRADVVLALSSELQEIVERLTPEIDVRPTHNPVELESVGDAGDSGPIALFCGEVGRRKGVDILAAAWPQVVQACPDARLLVAGPIKDAGSLFDLSGVEYLGVLTRDEVRRQLAVARLAVLPSRAEALPMFLLEACASGRPFVATNVGGIAGLVRENSGRIVPVGDVDALATAIVDYLVDRRNASRGGAAAYSLCSERFSVAALDRQYRGLYRELLG